MSKGSFVFLTDDTENKKIKLYFDVEGDICEVTWSNEDYINEKLKEFKAKDAEDLQKKLAGKEIEVYKYSYTDKEGKGHEGFTIDKPFPNASDPTPKNRNLIQGKVIEVLDNGIKLGILVDIGEEEPFVIVRGYSVYDQAGKKFYPLKAKKDKLLEMLEVDNFVELKGQDVTFVRQKAGNNFYYDA